VLEAVQQSPGRGIGGEVLGQVHALKCVPSPGSVGGNPARARAAKIESAPIGTIFRVLPLNVCTALLRVKEQS
jgi:hypothetical protein